MVPFGRQDAWRYERYLLVNLSGIWWWQAATRWRWRETPKVTKVKICHCCSDDGCGGVTDGVDPPTDNGTLQPNTVIAKTKSTQLQSLSKSTVPMLVFQLPIKSSLMRIVQTLQNLCAALPDFSLVKNTCSQAFTTPSLLFFVSIWTSTAKQNLVSSRKFCLVFIS